MSSITVYQTDLNGYYVCDTLAFENPIEPGEYLIPDGAYEDAPPAASLNCKVRRSGDAWIQEPVPTPPTAPPLTDDQIKEQRIQDVQTYMNSTAQQYGYDTIQSAVTYADEPAVPKFQAEGAAFRSWRSLIWEKCYEILDEVQAGEMQIPTTDELIAQLPVFVPPATT